MYCLGSCKGCRSKRTIRLPTDNMFSESIIQLNVSNIDHDWQIIDVVHCSHLHFWWKAVKQFVSNCATFYFKFDQILVKSRKAFLVSIYPPPVLATLLGRLDSKRSLLIKKNIHNMEKSNLDMWIITLLFWWTHELSSQDFIATYSCPYSLLYSCILCKQHQ